MSATNRGANRKSNDFYPTPKNTVESIFPYINWKNVKYFLEPCLGDKAIYDLVINKLGEESSGFLADWCELSKGRNYFDYRPIKQNDLILTNPPFSLALEFLEKSLTESSCVVYLLRLNFLGSQKRKEFWQKNPPTHLFVLSKRPSFTGKGTDATEYAWFCWDKADIINKENGVYVI